MKRALITGITGQLGSYLTEYLLSLGYEVHGIIRRSSSFNTGRIDHLYQEPHDENRKLFLHYGDITDYASIINALQKSNPDEIYHLACQSHVKISFEQPIYTTMTNCGTLNVLEAARSLYGSKAPRIYNAASSEMFGASPPPQNEKTLFYPRSPYAVGKVASYWFCVNYREAYNMFVSSGIMFNYESPRRPPNFVTRKITQGLAKIITNKEKYLYLGNLKAKRDWSYAGDTAKAVHLILQQENPDDYVVSTGESYAVEDFLKEAFGYKNLNWEDYIKIDPKYYRPTEVDFLQGDSSKIRALGWKPEVTFQQLVKMMVDYDLEKELGK